MRVSRKFSIGVLYILDQWVPPRLRDSRWFMYLPVRLVLKDAATDFMDFKDTVFTMDPKQFSALYGRTAHVQELQGETDLNQACIDEILRAVKNAKVLEAGCGRGYLAKRLAKKNQVTACDIVLPAKLTKEKSTIRYVQAGIGSLPFKNGSFDYVVSTHTLEHVQNLPAALAELRRVAKKGLVIVVPKQRPYRYGFSLHTQFFPYRWSLENALGVYGRQYTIKNLDGDWFYHEKV